MTVKTAPADASGDMYCASCEGTYPAGERCPKDGTRLVRLSNRDPLVGRELDARYTIVSKLGQGGMGAVYRGMQHSFAREVAIKVMNASTGSNPEMIKRFLREAKLASRLAHPNAVAVLDCGETADNVFYLVMELITGRTLADVLAEDKKLAPDRLVRIGTQVCEALESAHALSIVHRDLKPTNIMMLSRGRDVIKILDFGLAKSLAPEAAARTMTGIGAMLGTPAFMPPELATGQPCDGRADLYSLGCILFLLGTGHLPFQSDSVNELVAMHGADKAPPMTGVPAELGHIIDRLLAKSPDDRFQTATETREALERCLAPDPAAAAVAAPRPDAELRRRLPWLVGGVALAALGLTGVALTLAFELPDEVLMASGALALLGVIALGVFATRRPRPAAVAAATPTLVVAPPAAPVVRFAAAAAPVVTTAPPDDDAPAVIVSPPIVRSRRLATDDTAMLEAVEPPVPAIERSIVVDLEPSIAPAPPAPTAPPAPPAPPAPKPAVEQASVDIAMSEVMPAVQPPVEVPAPPIVADPAAAARAAKRIATPQGTVIGHAPAGPGQSGASLRAPAPRVDKTPTPTATPVAPSRPTPPPPAMASGTGAVASTGEPAAASEAAPAIVLAKPSAPARASQPVIASDAAFELGPPGAPAAAPATAAAKSAKSGAAAKPPEPITQVVALPTKVPAPAKPAAAKPAAAPAKPAAAAAPRTETADDAVVIRSAAADVPPRVEASTPVAPPAAAPAPVVVAEPAPPKIAIPRTATSEPDPDDLPGEPTAITPMDFDGDAEGVSTKTRRPMSNTESDINEPTAVRAISSPGAAAATPAAPAAPVVPAKPKKPIRPGAPRIGTYVIEDKLTRGAKGPTVFRGFDEAHQRDVHIESLPEELDLIVGTAVIANVSKIEHPNLVRVYELVVHAGKPYLVTEPIGGKMLDRLIAERRGFPWLEAVGLVDEVCAGLETAHDRAIVHRAIRPSVINVENKSIKLGGFASPPGLLDRDCQAPEIIAGGKPDRRSDIYAIGATLFCCLTGRAPGEAKLDPDKVPEKLRTLIAEMIATAPASRPASVKDIRASFKSLFEV